MTNRRSVVDISVLLVAVSAAGWPLLLGSVLAGHDLISHLSYAQQTAANLRLGSLLPAWGGSFNAGFGSPALIFYPPFTQTINAIPMLLGADAVSVLGPMALVSLLASGLAMRACCLQLAGPTVATASALVYMVAPYRLVTLYERTALAESWAFLWPPLIVWAVTRHGLPVRRRTVLVAVLCAGLILSNLPLSLLFLTGLLGWLVAHAIFSSGTRIDGDRLRSVAWGGVAALALSCFMLLPQALASQWLTLDHMFGGDAGSLRPSANTLFNPDSFHPEFNTRISIVLLATFAIIIVATLLNESARARLLPGGSATGGGRQGLLLLGAAVLCVACTVPPLGWWLDTVPVYSNIQFPWRVTALLTFIAAVLVSLLPVRRAWIIVGLTVCAAVPYAGHDLVIPRSTFSTRVSGGQAAGSVFPDPVAVAEAGGTGGQWRLRNLVDLAFLPRATSDAVLMELTGVPQPSLAPIRNRPAVLLEAPQVAVDVVEWTSLRRTVRLTTEIPATLLWRSLVFPGIEVTDKGRRLPTTADAATGLLVHHLQPGAHELTWQWRPFPLLRLGHLVSLGACVLLIALWCWPRRQSE